MKKILSTYEEASGQKNQLSKVRGIFSRNVEDELRENIDAHLGVQVCFGTGKYLGLPSLIGGSKKALLSFIKDRLWKRITSMG